MRLAVVVPTLNEAAHLEPLVRRLLQPDPRAQAADHVDRVVISDGGSDDGTLERAAELCAAFGDQLSVVSGPRGRGIQQQRGADALLAELDDEDVLVFVHADNWPEPGAFAALRAAALAGGDAFAFYQRVAAEGDFYRSVERYAERRADRGRVYGDSCLAARARAYRAVGGFRPLPLFEDLDLSQRLARRAPIRLVPGATVRVNPRRWQKEGRTVTVVRNWLLTRGFELGVPTRVLAWFYPRHS